jgi:hypothetical protein
MVAEPNDRDEEWSPDEDIAAPPPKPWGSRAQVVAAVLWSSFLAASLATMLFFAFVDPGLIHEVTTPQIEMTRMTGYAVGFFFFWLVAAISSAVSVYLIRTSRLAGRDEDGPR